MRIYIAEDDPSVIGVLEDILESSALGRVCGASEEGAPDPERIMALDPDLVLVDLLMPGRDGIQLVRELKELGSRAKFVMISQVSAKELIAKAYQAGVEFFIQKPINLIEVRQVVGNVIRQMENERALHTIQSVFQSRESQPAAPAGHPVHPEPAGHGRGEGGRGHHGAVPLPAGAKADGLSDRSGHPVQPAQ